MDRIRVDYCFNCGKCTEHRVIHCQDSALFRTFETVFTLGFGAMLNHNYECKCLECGKINTLTF